MVYFVAHIGLLFSIIRASYFSFNSSNLCLSVASCNLDTCSDAFEAFKEGTWVLSFDVLAFFDTGMGDFSHFLLPTLLWGAGIVFIMLLKANRFWNALRVFKYLLSADTRVTLENESCLVRFYLDELKHIYVHSLWVTTA